MATDFLPHNHDRKDKITIALLMPIHRSHERHTCSSLVEIPGGYFYKVIISLILIFQSNFLFGSPGDLDLTFGIGGKVISSVGTSNDYGLGVVAQRNGSIIVGGYYARGGQWGSALLGYSPTGSLVSTSMGADNFFVHGIALQSDGKLVAAGRKAVGVMHFATSLHNVSNGVVDGGNLVTTLVGDESHGRCVAIQSDGKIVVAGHCTYSTSIRFALARYTASGVLDVGFGVGGKVITNIGSQHDMPYCIAIQNDDKIILAGYSYNGTDRDFAIVRYTSSGLLDSSFSSNGKAVTRIGASDDEAGGITVQSDGKIVVTGYSFSNNNFAPIVARYTNDGNLDSSFGVGGLVIGSAGSAGLCTTMQPDGKILVGGISSNGANYDFMVARHLENGSYDPTFGNGGIAKASIGNGDDWGRSITLQNDGDILLAGHARNGPNDDFAIARFKGDLLKPSVSNLQITSITPSSALLQCNINPKGLFTTAEVQVGTTSIYDNTISIPLSDPDSPIDISTQVVLSNLKPNTTYHFQVVALNSAGNHLSSDNTFTTPRVPTVFIPGIAGSILEGGFPYRELWPTILPANINELALAGGPDNVRAVDVMRTFYVETGLGSITAKHVYDHFLDHLAPQSPAVGSYLLFNLDRDPSRLTSTHMLDQASLNPNAPKPTLFPFPYDWRKSNATHTSTLRQYIKRIRQLHSGEKVDIVTHSMGGLLMRRYFLDFPADASSDVRKVVTIAAPFWGAPKTAFRMLTGDFFDVQLENFPLTDWEINLQPIDYITRDSMKVAFATLPAVHELLPSSSYFAGGGSAVLVEDGFDLNGNGLAYNVFTGTNYQPVLDKQVRLWEPWIPPPSSNNTGFHTSLQDNSSQDEAMGIYVPTLHLYGSQPTPKTTIRTRARARTLQGLNVTLTGTPIFEQEFGDGDGTVPELSAARTAGHRASAAALTKLTHPDETKVDHNGIMQNERVWSMISEFLDSGTIPDPVVDTSAAATGLVTQAAPAPPALGRKKILILGTGYVHIRDSLGRENTQLSSIAANKIPGLSIQYGGDDPWVTIECSADTELTIDGMTPSDGIEMEVQQTNGGGGDSSLYRFRFSPLALGWKSSLSTAAPPTVHVDQNNSGTFEPNETISPTHTSTGSTIDTVQPIIAVDLSQTGNQVSLTLSATDNGGTAPSIRYSLDNSAIQNYGAPVTLPKNSMHRLQVFAEDASGNTSGLIDTTINPKMNIENGTTGITLQWPVAEAYVLEEAADLGGVWQVSDRLATRTGYTDSVTIPLDSTPRKFFRLRSQRTER